MRWVSVTGLVFVFYLFSFEARAQVSGYAYGAYGHYPVGSARVLAMGGAFTGFADDASAVQFNPAGLSITRYAFDFSSGENRIVSRETFLDPAERDVKTGIPYTNRLYSTAARFGRLGIGAGFNTPYELNYGEIAPTNSKRQLFIKSIEFATAITITPWSSAGVTYHKESVRLGIVKPNGLQIFEERTESFFQFGLLVKPTRNIGLGVNFTPGRRYDFNEDMDGQFQVEYPEAPKWFRDVVIPQKITLGLTFKTGHRLRWVGDIDIIAPVENALFVGGQETVEDNIILEKQQTILHGGFELEVVKNKKFEFTWRGGGYNEPKRFKNGLNRNHFTMGVEARFGYIIVSSSYDQATDFSNVSQSISIFFGGI